VLDGRVTIGADNRIHSLTTIGLPPQDFKYQGEPTTVVIGDGNVFRESCTVHRGTPKGVGATRIGSHGFFMVGSHIAHDCHVGDHVMFTNLGTLAGHVEVGDHAVIGAFSAVHQFCRVGPHAYIGGGSMVVQDAVPYCITQGNHARCYGVNRIGMRRKGAPAATIQAIEAAVRTLFRPGLSREQALAEMEQRWAEVPEVQLIVTFARAARRGLAPIRLGAESGEGE
jgi:UDP-N-acetylglucosamine acyltransferase